MGAPPPPNYPPPADDAVVSGQFGVDGSSEPSATICGFGIGLPKLKFGISVFIKLPPFPPPFPTPWFTFTLQCDLSNPVDASGGVAFGGGRPKTGEPDADDMEDAA